MRSSTASLTGEDFFEGRHFVSSSLNEKTSMAFASVAPQKSFFENVVISQEYVRPTSIQEKEIEWWLGSVTEIEADFFSALLEDLAGRKNIVEFELDQLSPNDRNMLSTGSIFTYSISSIHDPLHGHGGLEYKTRLNFSGKQQWFTSYTEKARKLADECFPEYLLD